MKHFTLLKTWLIALALMVFGVGGVMGETIVIVPDQTTTGSTATAYVATLTDFSAEGIGWAINNWNPKSLQVRGNNNSVALNFQFYNTSAIPGSITKVTMTYTAGTLNAGNNITLVTGSSVQSGTSSGVASSAGSSSVYWDLTGDDDFFRIQFVKGATTGTVNMGYIEVEYTAGSGTPSAAAPTFSPAGGTYFGTQNVSLSSATNDAKIYYTLDESDPSKTSTLYSSPISITSTTTVKAIAYDENNENPSSVSTAVYTIASMGGDGSKENPFTLEDVTTLDNSTGSTKYWVKGYIVGANEKDAGGTIDLVTSDFVNTAAPTMIFIADDINEDDIDAMHPVQLPTGGVRTALNLVDNPSNFKRDVLVYGTLEAYFGLQGVRNVTDYELGAPTGPIPTITVSETSLSFEADVDQTKNNLLEVEAENLTADMEINIVGTDAAMFAYALDGDFNYRTGGRGVVEYTPTVPGTHTATLVISSAGATSAQVALNGLAAGELPPLEIPAVIISEVYGGGGNSGATLKNDFIELYNTTDDNVSVGGWIVQYWSATGTGTPTANNVTIILPEEKYIPAKTHFLIQQAAGAGGTEDIDKPDVVGEIAMGATAGKVVLYKTDEAQAIDRDDLNSILNNAHFVDYVPFGKTAVPVWGSAMSSNTSSTKSATRKQDANGDYIYTGDINNDFELADPSPESTGLVTSVNSTVIESKVYAHNQVVYVNTTAGTSIDIFNVAGQKIISLTAASDMTNISVPNKGVLIVRVGQEVTKVVM